MYTNVGFYKQAWEDAKTQPRVGGPADFWYQSLGKYARAIACVSSRPFALPVGLTAEVTGINPKFVGHYLGELVRNGVITVERPGAPGRFTRYRWTDSCWEPVATARPQAGYALAAA